VVEHLSSKCEALNSIFSTAINRRKKKKKDDLLLIELLPALMEGDRESGTSFVYKSIENSFPLLSL
jgi:hypothetical protein